MVSRFIQAVVKRQWTVNTGTALIWPSLTRFAALLSDPLAPLFLLGGTHQRRSKRALFFNHLQIQFAGKVTLL